MHQKLEVFNNVPVPVNFNLTVISRSPVNTEKFRDGDYFIFRLNTHSFMEKSFLSKRKFIENIFKKITEFPFIFMQQILFRYDGVMYKLEHINRNDHVVNKVMEFTPNAGHMNSFLLLNEILKYSATENFTLTEESEILLQKLFIQQYPSLKNHDYTVLEFLKLVGFANYYNEEHLFMKHFHDPDNDAYLYNYREFIESQASNHYPRLEKPFKKEFVRKIDKKFYSGKQTYNVNRTIMPWENKVEQYLFNTWKDTFNEDFPIELFGKLFLSNIMSVFNFTEILRNIQPVYNDIPVKDKVILRNILLYVFSLLTRVNWSRINLSSAFKSYRIDDSSFNILTMLLTITGLDFNMRIIALKAYCRIIREWNSEHQVSHDFWSNSELLDRFLVLPMSIAESLVRSEKKVRGNE